MQESTRAKLKSPRKDAPLVPGSDRESLNLTKGEFRFKPIQKKHICKEDIYGYCYYCYRNMLNDNSTKKGKKNE